MMKVKNKNNHNKYINTIPKLKRDYERQKQRRSYQTMSMRDKAKKTVEISSTKKYSYDFESIDVCGCEKQIIHANSY